MGFLFVRLFVCFSFFAVSGPCYCSSHSGENAVEQNWMQQGTMSFSPSLQDNGQEQAPSITSAVKQIELLGPRHTKFFHLFTSVFITCKTSFCTSLHMYCFAVSLPKVILGSVFAMIPLPDSSMKCGRRRWPWGGSWMIIRILTVLCSLYWEPVSH